MTYLYIYIYIILNILENKAIIQKYGLKKYGNANECKKAKLVKSNYRTFHLGTTFFEIKRTVSLNSKYIQSADKIRLIDQKYMNLKI